MSTRPKAQTHFTNPKYKTKVQEETFLKVFKNNHGLKTKVNNFHLQLTIVRKLDEDFVIHPEWAMLFHSIFSMKMSSNVYFMEYFV
ncbi:hypothetical protein TSUD_92800 [Trifolium subterraneum]|uniref:Uncharacterized protein n=1 Tax=Trifolium subterraneum TaxID=3900 RepID=A0A2Z6N6J8_TRISU|nr:hypothetical protein TSUD_92800 [Trifolium subterraneum]